MYYTSKIYNFISKKAKQTYFVNLYVFFILKRCGAAKHLEKTPDKQYI